VGGVTVADMAEQTDVVVIGSGFAGIGMGIKLKAAGRHDFVILEQDSDLGGTWRDNTYPGCTCDVPSYLYSFSFEQNPHWSRLFSPQEEIWDYLRRCVDKYDLGPHLRFDATVTGAVFDDAAGRWDVEVNGSSVVNARVVVSGVGALHLPKTPDLPGLESFAGTTFHSSHWRHDRDLRGRNVAAVGTGASAIQFVPQIAPDVARLDLYQRSPAWVTPKPNPPISSRQRAFYARHPAGQRAVRSLVYWLLEARGTGFALTPKAMKLLERGARKHLEKQVSDPELRARLTPDYQIGCKRILLSNDFYPALARDNVELVTDPIARVTPQGIVDARGVQRDVDTIIFGTGFDISGNITRMKVVGRDGAVLGDVWDHTGVGAHLGITVNGFPNFFLLLGPNTGLAHNSVVIMIESQVGYVMQALAFMDSYGAAAVEVRADTQATWLDRVQNRLEGTVWQSGCSSWYLDEDGRNIAIWPYFTWKYWLETRKLDPSDFQLVRATVTATPQDPTFARR
jgi:cation diffusion facilitator CzcD-associated flavoprotein CzcO